MENKSFYLRKQLNRTESNLNVLVETFSLMVKQAETTKTPPIKARIKNHPNTTNFKHFVKFDLVRNKKNDPAIPIISVHDGTYSVPVF